MDKHNKFVIIIVNTIPPYGYEINNIIGLPEGFPYRFRYRQWYIPEIPDPSQISDCAGLIVLRNFETAKFIPVRKIRISNIRKVGDMRIDTKLTPT